MTGPLLAVQKRCIVTGGSSGIGLAVVRELVASGAAVSVMDQAEFVRDDDGGTFSGVHSAVTDVRVRESVRRGVEAAVGALGGIDLVVCAAGRHRLLGFVEIEDAEWQDMFQVNVMGVVNVVREALPYLSKGEEDKAVVVVSSLSGLRGHPRTSDGRGGAHYAASKAATIGLVKSLALEFAGAGIRVNAVAPGMTDTPLVERSYGQEEIGAYAGRVPLGGRLARAEEVARCAVFLGSELSTFVTGEVLVVGGGIDLV